MSHLRSVLSFSIGEKNKTNLQRKYQKGLPIQSPKNPSQQCFLSMSHLRSAPFVSVLKKTKLNQTNKYQQGLSLQSPKNRSKQCFSISVSSSFCPLCSVLKKEKQLKIQTNISKDCHYNPRRNVAKQCFLSVSHLRSVLYVQY